MNSSDQDFLAVLQKKAKQQAAISQSSPLPEWIKPLAAVVGMHYWQFLLLVSGVFALGISSVLFSQVYEAIH